MFCSNSGGNSTLRFLAGVARVGDRAARQRRELILTTWISRPVSLADVTPRAKGGFASLPISLGRPDVCYRRIARLGDRLSQPVEVDLALRRRGSISEMTMTTETAIPARRHVP
jgi:hypothetical protein